MKKIVLITASLGAVFAACFVVWLISRPAVVSGKKSDVTKALEYINATQNTPMAECSTELIARRYSAYKSLEPSLVAGMTKSEVIKLMGVPIDEKDSVMVFSPHPRVALRRFYENFETLKLGFNENGKLVIHKWILTKTHD